MEKDVIFGSNIHLPSIEGVNSGCEDELYLLMKEVDLAFERKNKDLIKEIKSLRTSCHEKQDEIEHWKSIVATRKQNSKSTDEHSKRLLKEVQKLKEENTQLKNENSSLQRIVERGSETENQLESLKNSLIVHQEENIILKDRMRKLFEEYRILREGYGTVLNTIAVVQKPDGSGDHQQDQQSIFPNFINELIAQETEKYLKEETEHSNEFQMKINHEIEELQRTFQNQQMQ